MQTMKYYSVMLLAGLALLVGGCGGSSSHDHEPDPEPVKPTGKHLAQTCDMEARASETTVTLTGLTAKVTRNTGSAAWLSVDVLPYESVTPQVKITTVENSQADSRQQELTFYAASDTLVLTVRQAAFDANGGTDVDNPFDTPSDQPAYERRH